jgi:LytR cell envelope-related transcriptional attenuator
VSAPTGHPEIVPAGPEVDGDQPKVYLDLPEVSTSHFRHRRPSRWWRYGFPAVLVLLIAAVPVLVFAGAQVVLKSNDGRLVPATADPKSPGWQATVPPTQTMALATLNDSGTLSSVALMALTSDTQGSVILIPVDTQAFVFGQPQTLVAAYKSGGSSRLKSAIEALTGTGVDDIMMANSGNWKELVAPAGPLTFDNPDDVIADGVKLFSQGRITVLPAQVGAFVEWRNWGEDDTNRLVRQEYLWKAWLTKIAAAPGSTAVPGELDNGIGHFLHAFAHEEVAYDVLPVQVHKLTTAYTMVFLPISAEVRDLVGQDIPFPTAVGGGSRPHIRVLDGTGRLGHGLAAAHNLALAGAQIDAIGNASSFRIAHTQFTVTSERERAEAQKLRNALGVGTVVVDPGADDSVDVTVVLGADAIGHPQAQSTTLAPTGGSGDGSGSTTVTTRG